MSDRQSLPLSETELPKEAIEAKMTDLMGKLYGLESLLAGLEDGNRRKEVIEETGRLTLQELERLRDRYLEVS